MSAGLPALHVNEMQAQRGPRTFARVGECDRCRRCFATSD